MNKKHAKNIIDKVKEINIILNNHLIELIDDKINDEELRFYKRAVGNIMGEMYDRLLSPIFSEYPDLMPKEMCDD